MELVHINKDVLQGTVLALFWFSVMVNDVMTVNLLIKYADDFGLSLPVKENDIDTSISEVQSTVNQVQRKQDDTSKLKFNQDEKVGCKRTYRSRKLSPFRKLCQI